MFLLMKDLRQFQAAFDQVEVPFSSSDSSPRFFLKSVEHVNHLWKSNGVNGPVGGAAMIFNHFEAPCSMKSLQRLRRRMLISDLSKIQSVPHLSANSRGNSRRSILLLPIQRSGLIAVSCLLPSQYSNSTIFVDGLHRRISAAAPPSISSQKVL
jgi:hypothetical protein